MGNGLGRKTVPLSRQLNMISTFVSRAVLWKSPVVRPHENVAYFCGRRTGGNTLADAKLDLLQGTLDLMVLQTLAAMGRLHGYGIARRIEQASGNEVLLNQGTIYASLVRLEQRGWIASKWGVSGNNRKAKFYSITKGGRKRLAKDARYWQRLTEVMDRMFAMGRATDEEPGNA